MQQHRLTTTYRSRRPQPPT